MKRSMKGSADAVRRASDLEAAALQKNGSSEIEAFVSNSSVDIQRKRQLQNNFIRQNFKRISCRSFSKASDSALCKHCDRKESEHNSTLRTSEGSPFAYDETDAFGEFYGENGPDLPIADYVRIAYDGSSETEKAPENVAQLFKAKHLWNLPKPILVVSVIGRLGNLKMAPEMLILFNHKLIKAMDVTSGWLITCGNNNGIAQVIGDAVRAGEGKRMQNRRNRRKLVCIGVTAWGCVDNRDSLLVNRQEDADTDYHRTIIPNNLNPDHNYFLIVDNGKYGKNALLGASQLRGKLEKEIANKYDATVVALVVEGGLGSLNQLEETLDAGTPVLVCDGTGGVADLLAQGRKLAESSKEQYMTEMEKLITANKSLMRETGIDLVKSMEKIYKANTLKKNQVTIFKLSDHKEMGMAYAFLECLMKKSKDDHEEHLRLSQTWLLPEIAKKILSKENVNIETLKKGNDIFHDAICDNNVEFVSLFIDEGFNVRKFLTPERLEKLYQFKEKEAVKTRRFNELVKIKKHQQRLVVLEDISKLLLRFTSFDHPYNKDEDHFTDPFYELFIYSVLFNRPLLVSLVGAWLAENLSSYYEGKFADTLAESYRDSFKKRLVELAIGILDTAYKFNPEMATALLNSAGHPRWSDLSVMEVAALAEAKDFLNHECCYREVFRLWSNGYDSNTRSFVFSFFCFWPMFSNYFVRFVHENPSLANFDNDDTTNFFDDHVEAEEDKLFNRKTLNNFAFY